MGFNGQDDGDSLQQIVEFFSMKRTIDFLHPNSDIADGHGCGGSGLVRQGHHQGGSCGMDIAPDIEIILA
jgi:hypothetical protein